MNRGNGTHGITHQFIHRPTGQVCTEAFVGDRTIMALYSTARERAPWLYRAAISKRMSAALGFFMYDRPVAGGAAGIRRLAANLGIDLSECLDPPQRFRSARDLFERKIRYWDTRPMPGDRGAVVSPADARVLAGSLRESSHLYLKESLFAFDELLGRDKPQWLEAFSGGDYAVFRLTPDKYHYNHAPVAGTVEDIYELDGCYHSCNPGALIGEATPASKNRRVVTVIDTDVYGGTGVGLVAMIEVVAMMIGKVSQCYSDERYDSPREVRPGMLMKKGAPKSLYRPGSSTDVLLFQKDRVRFSDDIATNARRQDVRTRFSILFGRPVVETEVRVREEIALRLSPLAAVEERKGERNWKQPCS
ncbi:MAG: phosphatidylserine decarboxylase [Desulfatibacillaceae bacterium]